MLNFSNVFLHFVDDFDKIMQSVSNTYANHLILYLLCKFHGNIPKD